uniref:Uncharacterized protein n=1 Tax=Oncorhynchus kisutch TaxID=8019 RepID=A0A8C7IV57_ONCKI
MKLWGWTCVLLLSLLALSESQAEAQGDLDLEMEDEMEEAMVTYKTPVPIGEVYFSETFDDGSLDRLAGVKDMQRKTLDDEIA